VVTAWVGAVSYALMLYFDFSGYSDMAIGLASMFGFSFDNNFDYPYMSGSITEFWRRWHISLGAWFREYIYFPLGGSRVPTPKIIRNLFVVWLFTGIWHGAS
jgi:D-alanyl-lipoteichoic acid acyltransferase DltB (MBOAT superfamily)